MAHKDQSRNEHNFYPTVGGFREFKYDRCAGAHLVVGELPQKRKNQVGDKQGSRKPDQPMFAGMLLPSAFVEEMGSNNPQFIDGLGNKVMAVLFVEGCLSLNAVNLTLLVVQ